MGLGIFNYWKPLRTEKVAWTSKRSERQTGAQAGVIDEVYLLHKTRLSRLVQKPTLKVKENEESKEYVPNKRTK